jgi:hypothetical protein
MSTKRTITAPFTSLNYDHHVRNDVHIQIMFDSFSPPGGFISYLHYWRLFSHNDVLHCVGTGIKMWRLNGLMGS